MTIASLPSWEVTVERSASDENPERVIVLAQDAKGARRFAVDAVRMRLDLPPSATLFASNARRVK